MTSAGSERDPLEQLADEFAQRYRRGERPTLTEYVERHPDLAEPIRELFPALVEMEQLRHAADAAGFPGAAGLSVHPEQLGDYRILREVARGGMGVVFEAVQESLGRHVALKVLPFHGLMNPNNLERFRREARAAARLHHTNIVPVFGVGEDNGICYYAMQFIQGQNLESVLHELKRLRGVPDSDCPRVSAWAASAAQGLLTGQWAVGAAMGQAVNGGATDSPEPSPGLPVAAVAAVAGEAITPPLVSSQSELGSQSDAQYYRSVARVGIQVAEALAYAHEQGIVHRDIKPSNLLLDTHGTVWVTDFGLAKEQDSDELTRSGDIVGTLRYMAPERFDGQADARSDVYGLGATLYELLTLAPPFASRDRAELLRQIAADQPQRPRQINRSIPLELETIASKALEKQPAERYATADALAEDLRRFLQDRPILARRPTLGQKLHKWSRRHRAVVTTAGVSAALACALAVAVLVASNVRIKRALVEETRAKNELADALDANEQTMYSYRIALAHREWWANRVARTDALLDECPERLRQWEWHYLKRLCHSEQFCFDGHAGDMVAAAAFSPDGKHVASLAWEEIKVWDAATGQVVLRIPVEGVRRFAFGPYGQRLAAPGRDHTAVIWDAVSGKEVLRLRGHAAAVNDVAFAPDGRTLATAGDDNTIKLWDTTSGRTKLTLGGHGDSVRSVAFSPDGRRVASSSNDRTVRVWDALDGEQLRQFTLSITRAWAVGKVAFSPDGRRISAASYDEIRIWDCETGEELHRLQNAERIVHDPVFSPDGHWLAVGSEDATVRIWDPQTAQEAFCLRGHTKAVGAVAFSREGRQLVSASNDGTVKVFAAPWEQDAARLPVAGAGYCMSVAFSRDGRLLASAHGDMKVRIWDPGTQRVIQTVPQALRKMSVCVAFSEDGRLACGNGPVVRICDPRDGREQATCEGHTGIVARLAFRPRGNLLASASSDTTVKLWDSTTGRELRTLRGHSDLVTCVTFSPDGRRLASTSDDQTVRLWDVDTGRELHTLVGHTRQAQSVAFHPDGRTLASGAADSTVRIWDTETGKLVHTYGAHVGVVADVAYSPDGRRLAAATGNGSIVIWDTRTRREALTLRGHEMTVKCVTFSPDGNLLASAALDGSIRIWNATPLVRPAGTEYSVAAQLSAHQGATAVSE